ncbi:hypothetical protein WQG_7930 [Bibersteinia trehalosi USDA-ARS-USMARC-192]|nr:hypothetical protein WQG_7930 [Bibersteinia trehalosi USDA-ARS-USMARC-192]
MLKNKKERRTGKFIFATVRRCYGVHYRDFKILCKRFFAKNLKKMTAC